MKTYKSECCDCTVKDEYLDGIHIHYCDKCLKACYVKEIKED